MKVECCCDLKSLCEFLSRLVSSVCGKLICCCLYGCIFEVTTCKNTHWRVITSDLLSQRLYLNSVCTSDDSAFLILAGTFRLVMNDLWLLSKKVQTKVSCSTTKSYFFHSVYRHWQNKHLNDANIVYF